jgi:hypothetical protein
VAADGPDGAADAPVVGATDPVGLALGEASGDGLAVGSSDGPGVSWAGLGVAVDDGAGFGVGVGFEVGVGVGVGVGGGAGVTSVTSLPDTPPGFSVLVAVATSVTVWGGTLAATA